MTQCEEKVTEAYAWARGTVDIHDNLMCTLEIKWLRADGLKVCHLHLKGQSGALLPRATFWNADTLQSMKFEAIIEKE